MTRQRAYQLRHRALGLCELCPRKALTKAHCAHHRRLLNAYRLRLYREKAGR